LMAILIAIWKEWLHHIDNSQRSDEAL
jgi:hypothetical protein